MIEKYLMYFKSEFLALKNLILSEIRAEKGFQQRYEAVSSANRAQIHFEKG